MRWTPLVVSVVLVLDSVQEALACCANGCSGHGTCTTGTCACSCYAQWTGGDCSERQCPSGLQWSGPAQATDSLHQRYAVCSNAGACSDGICTCQAGFQGLACERMSCPNSCSGHGACVSIYEAGQRKDDLNFFHQATYTGWDATRIYGCQCETGWSSYDCSKRVCAAGDDPVTTGQVDEVQVLDCVCSDTCSGYFYLSFRGSTTGPISFAASAAQVKASLEQLVTIDTVTVNLAGGSTVCDNDGVSAAITFTTVNGDVPPIRVAKNDLVTSGSTATLTVYHSGQTSSSGGGVLSVTGTKEAEICNGRGTCDTSSGTCTCLSGFETSNGLGAAGTKGDCGYISTAPSACPGTSSCSGHGTCSGASNYLCTCNDGWTGHDCSKRFCPTGKAWFAMPGTKLPGYVSVTSGSPTVTTTADLRNYISRGDTIAINGVSAVVSSNLADVFDATTITLVSSFTGSTAVYTEAAARPEDAHYPVECSGRGSCNTALGICECLSGFTGSACQKTICPNSCNGKGLCLSLKDLADQTLNSAGEDAGFTYGLDPSVGSTWDANMIFGCKCDETVDYHEGMYDFGSHDCSKLLCAKGVDQTVSSIGVDEVQSITCSATGGTFKVSFRGRETASLAWDITQTDLETALESLSTISDIRVTFDSGLAACSSSGVVTTITFLQNFGDLPLMTTDDSALTGGSFTASVAQITAGTKMTHECSRHGLCDRKKGVCNCFNGYVSGDSRGNEGSRGDCSARNVLWTGKK